MSPFDSSSTRSDADARRPLKSGRILLVGGDPRMRAEVITRLGETHHCSYVARCDDAEAALVNQRFDVVVIAPALPDGDGLAFLQWVRDAAPKTRTVVLAPAGVDLALAEATARKAGARSTLAEDAHPDDIADGIERVLGLAVKSPVMDPRVDELRTLARELGTSHDDIAAQVDDLCSEMMRAWDSMNDRIEEATMVTEFRTLLRAELDIEDVLRTALEYILTRTGPTNAAVFLPDLDGNYSLGAYVNYDCPRSSIDTVLGHICHSICPQMGEEEEIMAFEDASEFAEFIGIDDGFFADSDIIAFSCQHEVESMAVIVMFRSANDPFPPALARTLDLLRTQFAEQLDRIVEVHHRADTAWDDDGDLDFIDDAFDSDPI